MIIKPSNMSRRGFLQGILGITATIILPQRSLSYNSLGYDWRAEAIRLNDDLRKVDGLMAGMNEFIRVKLREDGFYRRILPPLPIPNKGLDPRARTILLPVPNIPFGALPKEGVLTGRGVAVRVYPEDIRL